MTTKKDHQHRVLAELYDSVDPDAPPGYLASKPLSYRSLQLAYQRLTGMTLDGVNIAEMRYKVLEQIGVEISPFEACNPLKKNQMKALADALEFGDNYHD